MKIITMFGGLFSFLLAYSHALKILGDRLERLEIVQFFAADTRKLLCTRSTTQSKLMIKFFFFYKDYLFTYNCIIYVKIKINLSTSIYIYYLT